MKKSRLSSLDLALFGLLAALVALIATPFLSIAFEFGL
jgi:hypothetical protein